MTRTLVTGCAGFIGSVVVRELLERGDEVIGFDNLSRGTRDAMADLGTHRRFTFIKGDVRSPEDVARAFRCEPRSVMHLAARHCIPECAADPAGTYAINVVGTENVWNGAVAANVERFLFLSTGDVYKPSSIPHLENDATEPFNVYGLSKLTSEKSLRIGCRGASVGLTIVRMFNVYGAGDRNDHLIPSIFAQVSDGARELRLGNLWPIRDYIYVEEAAEALVRLLTADRVVDFVNVGTGGGWSVGQVVDSIGDALGFALNAVSIPELQRPVERDVLRPNVDRLTMITGWRPKRTLTDGLREMATLAKS